MYLYSARFYTLLLRLLRLNSILDKKTKWYLGIIAMKIVIPYWERLINLIQDLLQKRQCLLTHVLEGKVVQSIDSKEARILRIYSKEATISRNKPFMMS